MPARERLKVSRDEANIIFCWLTVSFIFKYCVSVRKLALILAESGDQEIKVSLLLERG